MKQKNQSAVLSYYGLYLLQYLKENHPDKTADTLSSKPALWVIP